MRGKRQRRRKAPAVRGLASSIFFISYNRAFVYYRYRNVNLSDLAAVVIAWVRPLIHLVSTQWLRTYPTSGPRGGSWHIASRGAAPPAKRADLNNRRHAELRSAAVRGEIVWYRRTPAQYPLMRNMPPLPDSFKCRLNNAACCVTLHFTHILARLAVVVKGCKFPHAQAIRFATSRDHKSLEKRQQFRRERLHAEK